MKEEQEEPVDRRHPFNFHKCNSCAFRTKSLRVIVPHLRKHEVESDRFSCQTDNLEVFECQFCYFEYNLKIAVDRHETLVHGGQCPDSELELKGYVCDKCDFETYSLLVFARHVCDDSQLNVPVLRKKSKSKRHVVSDKRYKCEQCVYKTSYKSNLNLHILLKHTDPNKIQLFECGQCSYKAKIKIHLKQHILAKHANPNTVKWYECEQCAYKSKMKSCLRRHVSLMHHEIKWLQCEHCSYKAKLKNQLKMHIFGKHLDLWFECELCSYKAKQNFTLQKHIYNKHTLDKDKTWFKCDKCSYQGATKYYLKRHISRKHPVTL